MVARIAALAAALLCLLAVPAAAKAGEPADVVARGTDGRLWLFENNGTTTPYAWETRRIVGADWNYVDTMTLSDITLDGQPDVVAREPGLQNGTLWVHVNDPSMPSSPYQKRVWCGHGWNIAVFIAAGDVTGDGRPDIINRDTEGRMFLYPHNGRTTETPFDLRQQIGSGWQGTTALLLGDVTLDGRLDVVARDTDGFLWIYPPPAALRAWDFRSDTPYEVGAGWDRYAELDLGDVNGDGRVDVLARDGAGTLWIYLHNGAAIGANPYPTRTAAGTFWSAFTALAAT